MPPPPAPPAPPSPSKKTKKKKARTTRRLDWASLHQHTFGVDVLRCPCGGRRRIHAIHSTRKTAEERLLQLGHQLPSRFILPPTTAQPSLPLAGRRTASSRSTALVREALVCPGGPQDREFRPRSPRAQPRKPFPAARRAPTPPRCPSRFQLCSTCPSRPLTATALGPRTQRRRSTLRLVSCFVLFVRS